MGTSGQTLQEQDKLFLRKSIANKKRQQSLFTQHGHVLLIQRSFVRFISRPPVTQQLQETSRGIHCCFNLRLLVTTRASPSRYTTGYLQRLYSGSHLPVYLEDLSRSLQVHNNKGRKPLTFHRPFSWDREVLNKYVITYITIYVCIYTHIFLTISYRSLHRIIHIKQYRKRPGVGQNVPGGLASKTS
jgi:hypothetical protein